MPACPLNFLQVFALTSSPAIDSLPSTMAEKPDPINSPPAYDEKAVHTEKKLDQAPETILVDDTRRRASIALNIVENPLQVRRDQ